MSKSAYSLLSFIFLFRLDELFSSNNYKPTILHTCNLLIYDQSILLQFVRSVKCAELLIQSSFFSQSNTDFHSSFKSFSSMFPLYIGWINHGISQIFHKTEVFVPLSSPLIRCFLVFSTLTKSMAWHQKHQNDSITNISPQRSKGIRFSIKSFC